ncbi:hypothetical protein [Mycolicibacterium sediminis]|uniref:hypothetical protein n=1 Tax=Mycolicibacterium sediminis TaxID=1286180 RepID=UPI0013D5FB18|nr:hypothetical protein [Mycolicibacterium sediminis]
MTTNSGQRGTPPQSVGGWVGLAALSLGAAAYAGVSGIGQYRMQTIVDNPCIKNALDTSELERWLTVSAAVLLSIAAIAFVALLLSTNRQRGGDALRRHAWGGLAVAILLLLPVTNLVAGDPLGFDAEMLPNCVTMALLNEGP